MNKEKLIDLLKSDKSVKEAMEQLEFGCKLKILYDGNNDEYPLEQTLLQYISGLFDEQDTVITCEYGMVGDDFEIIGLPLSERFIRMYIFKKLNDFCLYKANFIYQKIYIELDNSKDFDNQSEEVYGKIYEALKDL